MGTGNGLGGKKNTPVVVNPQVPAAVALEHVRACTVGTTLMKKVARAISTNLVCALRLITLLPDYDFRAFGVIVELTQSAWCDL